MKIKFALVLGTMLTSIATLGATTASWTVFCREKLPEE